MLICDCVFYHIYKYSYIHTLHYITLHYITYIHTNSCHIVLHGTVWYRMVS